MTGQAWVWVVVAIVVVALLAVVLRRPKGAVGGGSSAPERGAPEGRAPVGEPAPVQAAPVQAAAVQAAAVQAAPVEAAAVQAAPVEAAPVEAVPVQAAPVQDAPVQDAPVDDMPAEKAEPVAVEPEHAASNSVVPAGVEILPEAPIEPSVVPSDPALAALDSGSVVGGSAVGDAAVAAVATRPQSYPGAMPPEPDGSAPSGGYTIKAIIGSKRFHDPSSPVYSVLVADVYFRDREDAAAAGFRSWGIKKMAFRAPALAPALEPAVAEAPAPEAPAPAVLPPGAVLPNADGSAPAGYAIKAVSSSKRFHDPGSPVYAVLVADVLFRDPEDAAAAGFRYWGIKKKAVPAPPLAPAAAEVAATPVAAAPAEAPAPATPAEAPDPASAVAVGPHPGSALPTSDGSAPTGYPIKGNAGSKRYHDPSSPFYSATRADVWFRDADDAAAAGFVHWKAPR